jgi:hypothetical protein
MTSLGHQCLSSWLMRHCKYSVLRIALRQDMDPGSRIFGRIARSIDSDSSYSLMLI